MSARCWWRRPRSRSPRRSRQHGGDAIVTDPAHPSGSDRIAEALQLRDPEGRFSYRGQPPGRPAHHRSAVDAALPRRASSTSRPTSPPSRPGSRIRRMSPIPTSSRRSHRCRRSGKWPSPATSCARSAPSTRHPIWHHIGVYAYRRPVLERFVSLPVCRTRGRPQARADARARQWHADRRGPGRYGAAGRRYACRTRNRPQHAEEDRMTLKDRLSGRTRCQFPHCLPRGLSRLRAAAPAAPSRMPSRR